MACLGSAGVETAAGVWRQAGAGKQPPSMPAAPSRSYLGDGLDHLRRQHDGRRGVARRGGDKQVCCSPCLERCVCCTAACVPTCQQVGPKLQFMMLLVAATAEESERGGALRSVGSQRRGGWRGAWW
jgi:hypothetical protein